MSPQQRNKLEKHARDFINRVVEINREHGMGDAVPEDTYRQAVIDSAEACKPLIRHRRRQW